MAMVGMMPVLCTSTLLQLTTSHEDTKSWKTRPVREQLSRVMAFTLPCTCITLFEVTLGVTTNFQLVADV